jgi:hypothetical protein
MRFSTQCIVLFIVLAVAFAGCSGNRRPKLPTTFPVTGVVTLEGKPVAGASVMFNATVGGGYGAVAVTDAAGRYVVTTFVPGDGVVPGDYSVAIKKMVLATSGDESPMAGSGDPKNVLPAKYADDSTSGFKATVEATPANTFDFALSK